MVIFLGIGCWVLGIGKIGKIPVVLATGVVMLFIGSAKGKKGFGIFTGFVGASTTASPAISATYSAIRV